MKRRGRLFPLAASLLLAVSVHAAEIHEPVKAGNPARAAAPADEETGVPLPQGAIEELHSSPLIWTGVAVSADGRVFANHPRWVPELPYSVVELGASGARRPYPDSTLNRWTPDVPADSHFVCVQSVVCDDAGSLWILDTGSPFLSGVVERGAKLVQVDLATDAITRIYWFDSTAAPRGSYLNDVRVDRRAGFAYLTDSSLGALLVLDLATGACRRVLEEHASTHSEDIVITVAGVKMVGAGGDPWQVHSDGIALNPERTHLYYQALTGRTLYRIPTAALRDAGLSDEELGKRVEKVAESGVSDGLIFDRKGRLYISALEEGAIKRLNPDGRIEIVARDPRISWPDSFALMPDGSVCFTTSRIHEGGAFKDEFKIYRLASSLP